MRSITNLNHALTCFAILLAALCGDNKARLKIERLEWQVTSEGQLRIVGTFRNISRVAIDNNEIYSVAPVAVLYDSSGQRLTETIGPITIRGGATLHFDEWGRLGTVDGSLAPGESHEFRVKFAKHYPTARLVEITFENPAKTKRIPVAANSRRLDQSNSVRSDSAAPMSVEKGVP